MVQNVDPAPAQVDIGDLLPGGRMIIPSGYFAKIFSPA